MFPLPPELSQIIIDQLWNDTASLRLICLVSKAAIPLTRKHLFYETKFFFKNRDRSTRFLNVLKSRTKPGEHIRSFWLIGSSPYQDDRNNDDEAKQQKTLDTERQNRILIQQIMAHIRFIREIHVENCAGEVLGSSYTPGLLPRLRQVVVATFHQVTFISLADLVDTLSYMPHCHSLRLENAAFGRETLSEVSNDNGMMIPLRTLYMGLLSKGAFIEWVLASSGQNHGQQYNEPGPKITTLILKHITQDEGKIVKKLLRSLGDSLEHLDIKLAASRSNTEATNIDLRHNTNLRYLAFDDWLMSPFSCPPDWCTLILKSLSIGSTKLETVVFRFQTAYTSTIDTSSIVILQNETLFPRLRAVVFENRRNLQPELALGYLNDNLPNLSTRGVLEYKMIPPDTLYHWRNLHTSRTYDEAPTNAVI